MSDYDRDKWNRIYGAGEHNDPIAARVLAEFEHLLPATGRALDLACGRGGNALLLARHGLETWAWDISDTAVRQLDNLAREKHVAITVQQRDVVRQPPEACTFDVIVVSHFLDRALLPAIHQALCYQGLLFYQTFIRDKAPDCGPGNPAYLLESNELLSLFRSMHILCYREEGSIGDTTRGFRNEAMIIAQKR